MARHAFPAALGAPRAPRGLGAPGVLSPKATAARASGPIRAVARAVEGSACSKTQP